MAAEICGLSHRRKRESGMKGEYESGFFRDDGTEINLGLIVKPTLCVTCRKDDDPEEEILCTLTRADQQGEKDFKCFAYEARS
jgi:hypothetical protein